MLFLIISCAFVSRYKAIMAGHVATRVRHESHTLIGSSTLLRPQEGQQVGVELLLVREGQAVGRPRIDLQGRVLDELGGEQGGVSDRHDLDVVAMNDQGRNS